MREISCKALKCLYYDQDGDHTGVLTWENPSRCFLKFAPFVFKLDLIFKVCFKTFPLRDPYVQPELRSKHLHCC